jgi:putative ABC transport system permease protein/lipoprotein-releasing system permease protein
MNPLSPFTYYLRHKRSTLLILALISLMTLGVGAMVRLIDSLWEEMYNAERYLTRLSLVSAVGPSLDPGVVLQIRTHPDVAQVIQEKSLDIELPQLLNSSRLFGVSEANIQVLMDACGLRLKKGRLLRPRTNEMVLSEEIANAMGIQIGDQIDRSIGESWTGDNFYEDIPVPLELVGILEGTGPELHIRLGFVSYEYVASHEQFKAPWTHALVVIAQEGRKDAVDEFLESEIASSRTYVMTHRRLSERLASLSGTFHLILGLVDLVVAAVIALVVGMINQIAQTKRLKEFGLLNAVGYSKNRLFCRFTLETAGIAVFGWGVGLGLSWLLFALLKANFYAPKGMDLSLANLTPIWFSIPVPLAATAFVALSTIRTFARLDAVAIVERCELSIEVNKQQKAARRSLKKPLSSFAFYLRHRRRGLALALTMGLTILGVSFPAFLFAPMGDAMRPFADPLRQMGVVVPRMGSTVDPGLAAQIRANPDVARVIAAFELPLRVQIPPLGWQASVYGVTEDDMQTLIDLHKMQVKEGRLPRPHTNEIAISEAVALNRDLRVGDTVGQPNNRDRRELPTDMVIVGILQCHSLQLHSEQAGRPSQRPEKQDLWIGFASYEFLSSHELYDFWPVNLLVIPAEGRKAELDTWLRENVHSDLAEAHTFEWMLDIYRKLTLVLLLLFGTIEGIIAVVAAIALAVLSYTFFLQRREEFGILHAMGHSRWWLVLRTAKEMVSVVTVAWLMDALFCGIGLLYMRINVYAPKGLALNLLNPGPWLFTLPIPLTVIATSAGLVTWMLSRLDPVSVIERR